MTTSIHSQPFWSTLRTRWALLYHNRIITTSTVAVLTLYCLTLLFIIISFSTLPPVVPLWFTKPWGVERLAHPLWLFLQPIVGMIIFIIDVFLSLSLSTEFLVFSQLLMISAVAVNMASFISVFSIISLMG